MHILKLTTKSRRRSLLAASALTGLSLLWAGAAAAQEASVEELVVTGSRVSEASVAIGTDEATALKSLAGVANARLAYELFEKEFATDRAKALTDAGANLQRPLWASTGVKDPALPDTLYVTELVAPGVVNTMPEKTMEAVFDHGVVAGDTVTGTYDASREVFEGLKSVGVDFDDVTQVLEDEGVEKFIASWHELQDTVATALQSALEIAR